MATKVKIEVLSTVSKLITGIKAGTAEDDGTNREGELVRTPCDVGEILTEDGQRVRVYLRTQTLVDAFNEIEQFGPVTVIRTTRTVREGKVEREQMFHDFLKTEARLHAGAKPAQAEALER
jgi:hypothetical protein